MVEGGMVSVVAKVAEAKRGVEEMEIFSARNHHLAELSVGYVF